MANFSFYLTCCVGLVCVAGMCNLASGDIHVLGFDDINPALTTYEAIPTSYGGLTWTNALYIYSAWSAITPSGYNNAPVSGDYAALNPTTTRPETDPMIVTSSEPFSFLRTYLTAAFRDDLEVTVDAYLDGTPVATRTVVVNTAGPTLVEFGSPFWNVDTLVFSTAGGVPHAGFDYEDKNVVLDDFTFNDVVVPAPAAVLLGLLGLGAAGWRLRRN